MNLQKHKSTLTFFIVIAIVASGIAAIQVFHPQSAFAEEDYNVGFIDNEKLAFELIYHAYKYNIVNVTDKDSVSLQIPTAFHIRLSDIEKQQYHTTLFQPYKRNIFIAEDTATAIKAGIKASLLGDKHPIVLRGTVQEFRNKMMSAQQQAPPPQKSDYEKYVFYQEASKKLLRMEEKLKNLMKPPKKEVTKAKGGCA